jgi:predicted transport protein
MKVTMPLYTLTSESNVQQIKPTSFQSEKQLQNLFEANLEKLLGVRFIASEFFTGDRQKGRIDTLGIDQDGSPTIIEYKKSSKENVINQGLFYMDWLVDHKGDFAIAAQQKIGNGIEIDWAQPRLILIAESFSDYDKYAVNRIGANIELWTYRCYGENFLYLDPLFTTNPIKGDKSDKQDSEFPPVSYTVEDHLKGKNENIRSLFLSLEERIIALAEEGEIFEKPVKTYIGYKHGKNFCEVEVQSNSLKIWLDMSPKDIDDPHSLCRDVSGIGHYGTGDVEVRLNSMENLSKVMGLVEQAYRLTT